MSKEIDDDVVMKENFLQNSKHLSSQIPINNNNEEFVDEIVSSYDVYLTDTLSKNLNIFRYPLRPKTRPYSYDSIKSLKIKPKHRRVLMSFEIPKSENYSPPKRKKHQNNEEEDDDDYVDEEENCVGEEEEIGEGVEENEKDKKGDFVLLSKQNRMKINYCVCVKRGNGLHLTPINCVYSFYPHFENFGKVEEKEIEKNKVKEIQTNQGGEVPQKKKKKKKPFVMLRLTEDEEEKKRQLFQSMKTHEGFEDWVNLKPHKKNSDISLSNFEGLLQSPEIVDDEEEEENTDLGNFIDKFTFQKTIFPNVNRFQQQKFGNARLSFKNLKAGDLFSLTLSQAKKLESLEEKLKWVLYHCHLTTLDECKKLLELNVENFRDKVIVEGLLKSSRLFTKKLVFVSKSELYKNELNVREMVVRNYLILLFQEEQYVCRKTFLKEINNVIPSDRVLDVFRQIGVLETKSEGQVKKWKVKKDNIQTEITSQIYKNFIEFEQLNWERLRQDLTPIISSKFLKKSINKSTLNPVNYHGLSAVGTNEGKIKKMKLIEFCYKEFMHYGVLTYQVLRQHFNFVSETITILKSVKETEFKSFFKKICRPFRKTTFILKKISKNENFEKLRATMIDIVLAHQKGIDKTKLLNEICKKMNIDKNSIKPQDFMKIAKEIAEYKNSLWISKDGNPTEMKKDLHFKQNK